MKKVSIIVRTKNEERWIAHCLTALRAQTYANTEIILVDNESTDHTVEVAKRFDLDGIVQITEYKPGFALNEGIRASSGDYIACLSAHCVPANDFWLERLVAALEEDDLYAGAYGRQLPVAFTPAVDKRDLLTVFGLDRRIQIKDHFFHNANSVLRRSCWEAVPFDEAVTNVEDRVWGKAMIEAGYRLIYEPDAAVHHHHGLNHSNDERRASGVVNVIERMSSDDEQMLPQSLMPEHCHVAALLPVIGAQYDLYGANLLEALIEDVKAARFVDTLFLLSESKAVNQIADKHGAVFVERPTELTSPDVGLGAVMSFGLEQIEKRGFYPEAILFADYRYQKRPAGLFDELIEDAQYKGLDTVFPGYIDYHNYWRETEDGMGFETIGDPLLPRTRKKPLYRALYGLGCLTSAPIARQGKLVGGRIGILPVPDQEYTARVGEDAPTEPK